jgi:hypothetical protein
MDLPGAVETVLIALSGATVVWLLSVAASYQVLPATREPHNDPEKREDEDGT